MSELDADVAEVLAEVGVFEPDPQNEVHQKLVAAIRRTRGQAAGVRLAAMRWVFAWALEQEGTALAETRAAYDSLKARHMIRFRDAGERSGEMCEKRADAMDDVKDAHLSFRVAEQRERLARKRLDAISDQIKVWQSLNANERAADFHHARSGT